MIKNKKNIISGKGIYDKTVNFLTGSKLKNGEMHAIIYDPIKKKIYSCKLYRPW